MTTHETEKSPVRNPDSSVAPVNNIPGAYDQRTISQAHTYIEKSGLQGAHAALEAAHLDTFCLLENPDQKEKNSPDKTESKDNEDGVSLWDLPESIAENIKRYHTKGVDFGKMWTGEEPIFFLGETHPFSEDRQEIVKAMETFQRLKVKAIAMEAFEKKDQHILDDYYSGKVGREAILELAKKWKWDPESYVDVVAAAKDKDIKIIALREPTVKKQDGIKDIDAENEAWASTLFDYMTNHPNDKVAALVGLGHAGYEKNAVNEILMAKGIKSVVARFQSNDKRTDFGNNRKVSKTAFMTGAEDAGLAQQKFFIRNTDSARGKKVVDYFIYIPRDL